MILATTWPSAVIKRVFRSVARLRQLANARHSVLCRHKCAALSALALNDSSAATQPRHVLHAAACQQNGTEGSNPTGTLEDNDMRKLEYKTQRYIWEGRDTGRAPGVISGKLC